MICCLIREKYGFSLFFSNLSRFSTRLVNFADLPLRRPGLGPEKPPEMATSAGNLTIGPPHALFRALLLIFRPDL